MKKFFALLSFVIFFVFYSYQVAAAPGPPPTTPTELPDPRVHTTIETSLGVDPLGQNGPNPAPPIGFTVCGKTMCNENEVCTSYPGDADEHCVPKDKIPLPQPTPPKKLPADIDMCPDGEGTFPPNSTCINNFKNTQEKIAEYQKTCIYEPIVSYKSDRWPISSDEEKDQPFVRCGKGYAGPEPAPRAPSSIDKYFCSVNMLVYTDVRDAEIGSYGPSKEIRDTNSTDFIAQNYLYDSLFGKPMDLTMKTAFSQSKDNPKNNREAYRTYWRLLSASTQANLRSFMLNMASSDQINNTRSDFVDTNGKPNKTDLKSLYSVLNKQVILFLHFPFIRVGCLTDYPVCPEYAQAIKSLRPATQSLTDYLTIVEPLLPPGVSDVTRAAITAFEAAQKIFGNDLDGPYDAFVPLDFDSLRSYIVMKPTPDELAIYSYLNYRPQMLIDELNKGRYGGDNRPPLANVSRENIPYMGAIYQGLLSPKFGILASLQPSWLIDTYATPGGVISDYKRGNTATDSPEIKIANQNFFAFMSNELDKFNLFNPSTYIPTATKAIIGSVNWIYEQAKDAFTKDDIKFKGYTPNDEDLKKDIIKDAYVNFEGCPLPISYHLVSPKTAAELSAKAIGEQYTDHHQVVTIWGPQVEWNWDPKPFSTKKCHTPKATPKDPNPSEVCDVCQLCEINDLQFNLGDPCTCYKRHWTVSGTEHGKALTVLNNPKATDIKTAVVQDSNISLYKTLIPDAFNKKKITDASVDAPYAANYSSFKESPGAEQKTEKCVFIAGSATAPNGVSCVQNEVEPINRINNRAQDTMHLLQNCWTLPEEQQNSPRCKLALVDTASESGKCTGEAFRKIVPQPEAPGAPGKQLYDSVVKSQITDEVMTAYAEAEKQTGVPCEVLAGIHYREGDNSPDKDLMSGAPLNGKSLAQSAIEAAEHLKEKAGGDITTLDTLIKALSWYNGGGNSNCRPSSACPAANSGYCGSTLACSAANTSACVCPAGGTPEPGSCRALCTSGYPYIIPTSPGLCPPQAIGYDDPYVTELWKSPINDNMYILYGLDCTSTAPVNQHRLGTLTTAISLFLDLHGSAPPPQNGP